MLRPSLSLPAESQELLVRPGKTVRFLTLYPLYREEMELAVAFKVPVVGKHNRIYRERMLRKLVAGPDVLFSRFEDFGIRDVLDANRPNVAAN